MQNQKHPELIESDTKKNNTHFGNIYLHSV